MSEVIKNTIREKLNRSEVCEDQNVMASTPVNLNSNLLPTTIVNEAAQLCTGLKETEQEGQEQSDSEELDQRQDINDLEPI